MLSGCSIRTREQVVTLKEIRNSVLHFFFPHTCTACGSDTLEIHNALCLHCTGSMPETNFEFHTGNPVEKLFWGRIPLVSATALFYFTKESLMQQLMHQFKYNRNRNLGLQLGRIMGDRLLESSRFKAEALLPLPLFPARERKRGFNQSAILCRGMAEILNLPILDTVIVRPDPTETQTNKARIERWKNMEGKFLLKNPVAIQNKHVLLVDDVITTGATLESCSQELLKADNVLLSIAALCVATK